MDNSLENIGSKSAVVDGLPLTEYLEMRDTIVNLVETTKTHKEFIKEFRRSLLIMMESGKKVGIDMSSMYDYYQNLDFKPIEGFEFIRPTSESSGCEFILVIKYPKEVNPSLNDLNKNIGE